MIAEAVLTRKLSVRHVRSQLQLSQEDLERASGITRKVIWKAEKRQGHINLTSAYAMLNVFNRLRRDRGMPELDVHDLDWKIAGEAEEED